MDEKVYKSYLEHELSTNIDKNKLQLFKQFTFKQILLNLIKEQQINSDEALRLNKILKIIIHYDSVDDMIKYEDNYYKRFNCQTEIDKIRLEIGYLKTKLLNDYSDQSDPLIVYPKIVDVWLALEKMEILLSSHITDDLITILKREIISLELKLNIEIKFLYEAHEYFKDKIYNLNMK